MDLLNAVVERHLSGPCSDGTVGERSSTNHVTDQYHGGTSELCTASHIADVDILDCWSEAYWLHHITTSHNGKMVKRDLSGYARDCAR
jgi:hypothetical protein